MELYSNELYHHGIKGQRWGVRRYRNQDGSLTYAGKKRYGSASVDYSKQQYDRDRQMYGGLAARRINRQTLRGRQVSAARSKEARRLDSTSIVARTSGQLGKTVGAAAGGIGGYLFAKKYLSGIGDRTLAEIISASVGMASAYVGGVLGKYSNISIGMLAGGYSPNKYRKGA